MFVVSGAAVGSLYALGGSGLVVLFRATGVLNLAAGAIGAAAVMPAWQAGQWGLSGPLAWAAGLGAGLVLALAYGRGIAPPMAWREPVVKAVASLGYALILLGLVSFLWSDDPRKFELPTDKAAVMIAGLRVTVPAAGQAASRQPESAWLPCLARSRSYNCAQVRTTSPSWDA